MSYYYGLLDPQFNKRKTGRQLYSAPFTDQDFDIASPGAYVQLTGPTINSTQGIDVMENGVLLREGVSNSWTRDIGNNRIVFNFTLPTTSWVRVRLYI